MKKILIALFGFLFTLQAFGQTEGRNYGNNLITVAPLSIIDKGLGIGFSYERMLDKEQKIAFVIPVDFVFDDLNNDNWNGDRSSNLFYTYASPGIIFYPAGLRKVNYGIGPNLMFAYGTGDEWRFNSNGWETFESYSNFRMGLMVNNYLLMNVKEKIAIQVNFGLGLRYINTYTYENNITESFPVNVMGQFKFTVGYRF